MMLVVSAVTAIGLIHAQRNVSATVKRELERQFEGELTSFHAVQSMRHAALAERCRALARKPRIHAALEDNALDLLYPSARDELLEVALNGGAEAADPTASVFRARFYRFLDSHGAVLSPTETNDVGPLTAAEESQLGLPGGAPAKPQSGYLVRNLNTAAETIDELIAMPVVSTETGQPIAALVLGFKPIDPPGRDDRSPIRGGIWVGGILHLPALSADARAMLTTQISRSLAQSVPSEHSFTADVGGAPSLVFCLQLNPGSPYPPAYEVAIYPLAESFALQRRLFWQFAVAGGLILLAAFIASHFLSVRLAVPVEQLAVDSEENFAQRVRAEAALEISHEELQRSARFSADASHQLKTPVTVLRAGLEDLLAGETLSPNDRTEVSSLVHQTFRLTSVIEDLLLLSRMDAGRLKLELNPVDLVQLIEGWLDDLDALSGPLALTVEKEFPTSLMINGEKRYTTLILQNLLENARKYNRPQGRIRIEARVDGPWAILTIGNTGKTIPSAAQGFIFQRFHRGAMGEDLPGHGLGLNLARELVRLHQGDLRLIRSAEDWTEFEARFSVR